MSDGAVKQARATHVSPRGGGSWRAERGSRSPLVSSQRVGRRRRAIKRLRRRVVAFAVLGLVAGGATVGLHWLLTTPRFAVTSIAVLGASRVPVDQILDAAAIERGTNLLRIDPTEVTARVEAMPQIRRADVIREFPDRLTIVVEERRPFTLVHAGRLHWLDEEARLVGEESLAVAPPTPVISGLSEDELATMRTAPAPKARTAIALVRALLRSGTSLPEEISEIDMSRREGPVLYTVDGLEVRLGAEQWDERLARLESVLGQLAQAPEAAGGPVTAIDLRFKDQIVLQRGGSR